MEFEWLMAAKSGKRWSSCLSYIRLCVICILQTKYLLANGESKDNQLDSKSESNSIKISVSLIEFSTSCLEIGLEMLGVKIFKTYGDFQDLWSCV